MAPTSASLFNMTTKFCPPHPNAEFESLDSSAAYIVNAALNVPLAIATTFANLLVLLAMRHVTSIRLPSKLLLCSLVLTDLGVGLVVQPQFAMLLFMKAFKKYRAQCFLEKLEKFTGSLFSGASLITMTAISLDRYTALFHYLKYHQIVTIRRVSAVLAFTWSSALLSSLVSLWNRKLWGFLVLTPTIIGLLVISVAHIKVYRRLRGQHGLEVQPQPQANDQAQQQAGNTLNMAKYKRTASAMMWIYILFVSCYLPFLCTRLVITTVGYTPHAGCILEYTYTLVLMNSCLNPFVYCLRLPEIRTEAKKQLQKFCCRSLQE